MTYNTSDAWEALCMALDVPLADPKKEALEVALRIQKLKNAEQAACTMLATLKVVHARWDEYDESDSPGLGRAMRSAIIEAETAGIRVK